MKAIAELVHGVKLESQNARDLLGQPEPRGHPDGLALDAGDQGRCGRRLFEISCRDLAWAVIDSGIDAEHPAFPPAREGKDHASEPFRE